MAASTSSAGVNGHSSGTPSTSNSNGYHDVELSELEYDPVQLELMKEELILLDYDDKPIGEASKKTCAWGRYPRDYY